MVPQQLVELKKLAFPAMDYYYFNDLHKSCEDLISWFEKKWPEDLPLPFCYPADDNRVMMLWVDYPNAYSVEYFIIEGQAYSHKLNMITEDNQTESIFLYEDSGWDKLIDDIRSIFINDDREDI